jgi:hypothetical protein
VPETVSVIKFVIVSVIALIAAAWVSVQFPGYARSLAPLRAIRGTWWIRGVVIVSLLVTAYGVIFRGWKLQ